MTLATNAASGRPPTILAGTLVFVYSALLTMVIALLGLWSAVSMLRRPKHREGLGERFGRVRPDLVAAVVERHVVWVHAVSVGEVLAASRLVKELGEASTEHIALVRPATEAAETEVWEHHIEQTIEKSDAFTETEHQSA